jgi:hypothetical protein
VVTTTSSLVRPEAEGEQVERLGGVAREQRTVRARVAADEATMTSRASSYRALVSWGPDPGAAVHARVPGQEVVHRTGDDDRCRAGGGGVEVDVLTGAAVEDRHPQVVAHVLAGREGQRDLHVRQIDL